MIHRNLELLVLTELNLRIHADLERVGQLFVLVNVVVLQRRTADNAEIDVFNAERVSGIGIALDRLFIEDVLAIHTLDHGAGRFALAEAGDIELLFIAKIDLVDLSVERGGVNKHLEGSNIVFFFLDVLDIH